MVNKQTEQHRWFGMDRDHVVLGMLLGILITALLLRIWRLGVYGYGNEYYAAAVKSMLQSWHNFFYVAAEPGGSVMVDKPPLGLWLQAMSALIFGVNGFSLALPSALAGTLSVYILFLIVKAIFNHHAALTAAFFLAVIPGVVWVDRTNLLDSMVMCALMIAVWFMLNAILLDKWYLLVVSFAVIGLGFNIKMLQAFLILPAMALVYFFGVKRIWWERLIHLIIAVMAMSLVSFSWVVIVDLTPSESRPYVSSTATNSMFELVIGHNGLNRLINLREQMQLGIKEPPDEQLQPPVGMKPRPGQQNNNQPIQGGLPNQYQQHGVDEIGEPGFFRLFQQPLAHQVSWLLGFALLSMVFVPFFLNWKLPLQPQNQLYLLIGIWLLTEVVFFSVADFFHAYYLVMLGVPIAAMGGLGIWGIMQLWDQESWRGFAVSIGCVVLTVVFNTVILNTFGKVGQSAKVISSVLAILVIIGLVMCTVRRHCIWRNVALMGVVIFLGSAAFLWTIKGIDFENPSERIAPAGARAYVSVTYKYSLSRDQQNLLFFLLDNTDQEQDLMLVTNSSAAAPYVLASGRGIFTTGGFTGRDPVVTNEEVIAMIEADDIHFVLAQMDRNSTDPALMLYYQENCQVRVFRSDALADSRKNPTAILDCRKPEK